MPRITRKQQKVFAENASNNGVFGSLQANDPAYSQDPDLIQGRTAYANGWNDATYSAEKLPPLEEFQSLQYLFSRQIAYLMQDGIPEWNSSTTYYKGALVKAIQGDGSFILYASLIDDNTNNLVTDTTKWVITNTSTNFHQGIPNWRADVIYSEGDWVKALNGTKWAIFESTQNSNLNNAVTDTSYWQIKPFTSELNLFTPQWFDYEITDVSWLRADTFSWQDGTVYTEAYNHLVNDNTNGTAGTDVIAGITIYYVLGSDGHKIVLTDGDQTYRTQAVEALYNATGVAWYYILDTTNQRFKLPRENPAREELTQVIRAKGNGKALGFSDGYNTAGLTGNGYHDNMGRGLAGLADLYGTNVGTVGNWNDFGTRNAAVGVTTDSTKSGIISDMTDSTSVYKGKKYLYFYVGNFSQTATEQTAGLNSELFNGKVDLDAGNLSDAGKIKVSNLAMPSDTYDDITLLASGVEYTAPSNGYVHISKSANATNQFLYLWNSTAQYGFGGICSKNDELTELIMPISKGQKFTVNYNYGGTTTRFRFIYANGSESEVS